MRRNSVRAALARIALFEASIHSSKASIRAMTSVRAYNLFALTLELIFLFGFDIF